MTVTKCQAEEAAEYWVSRKAVSRVSHSERLEFRDISIISRMIESYRNGYTRSYSHIVTELSITRTRNFR